jgi:hypothetical protein
MGRLPLPQIRGVYPHFYIAVLGMFLFALAQFKVEADLESRQAMPTVSVWKERTPKHLWAVFQTHRRLYPKSIWRLVAAAGLGLILLSPVILCLEKK